MAINKNKENVTAATRVNTAKMRVASLENGRLNRCLGVSRSEGIVVVRSRAGHCHVDGFPRQVSGKQIDEIVFKTA